MRADHGIVTHLPLGMSQGVGRNSKAILNLPLTVQVAAEVKINKEIQLDVTYAIPESKRGAQNSNQFIYWGPN